MVLLTVVKLCVGVLGEKAFLTVKNSVRKKLSEVLNTGAGHCVLQYSCEDPKKVLEGKNFAL